MYYNNNNNNNQNPNFQPLGAGATGMHAAILCYNCKQPGHIARDCPLGSATFGRGRGRGRGTGGYRGQLTPYHTHYNHASHHVMEPMYSSYSSFAPPAPMAPNAAMLASPFGTAAPAFSTGVSTQHQQQLIKLQKNVKGIRTILKANTHTASDDMDTSSESDSDDDALLQSLGALYPLTGVPAPPTSLHSVIQHTAAAVKSKADAKRKREKTKRQELKRKQEQAELEDARAAKAAASAAAAATAMEAKFAAQLAASEKRSMQQLQAIMHTHAYPPPSSTGHQCQRRTVRDVIDLGGQQLDLQFAEVATQSKAQPQSRSVRPTPQRRRKPAAKSAVKPAAKAKRTSRDSATSTDTEYDVQSIVDKRILDDGTVEYKVRWTNTPADGSQDTYEPADHLHNAQEACEDYEVRMAHSATANPRTCAVIARAALATGPARHKYVRQALGLEDGDVITQQQTHDPTFIKSVLRGRNVLLTDSMGLLELCRTIQVPVANLGCAENPEDYVSGLLQYLQEGVDGRRA